MEPEAHNLLAAVWEKTEPSHRDTRRIVTIEPAAAILGLGDREVRNLAQAVAEGGYWQIIRTRPAYHDRELRVQFTRRGVDHLNQLSLL